MEFVRHLLLNEVTEFVSLARDGAYKGQGRRRPAITLVGPPLAG